MTDLERYNRRANRSLLIALVGVVACLAAIGQPWYWGALAFAAFLIPAVDYTRYADKAWTLIGRGQVNER